MKLRKLLSTIDVALCEEGVDRNSLAAELGAAHPASPSAKRAWIEIQLSMIFDRTQSDVALCEEGVDRNWLSFIPAVLLLGRPLRRGRG